MLPIVLVSDRQQGLKQLTLSTSTVLTVEVNDDIAHGGRRQGVHTFIAPFARAIRENPCCSAPAFFKLEQGK